MAFFDLKKIDSKERTRLGTVNTVRGSVSTPAFLPAGASAVARSVTPGEMRFWGAEGISVSSYHLLLKPGPMTIIKSGGLHDFLNWPGTIFTDSGAQIFNRYPNDLATGEYEPKNITVTEVGITFRAGSDAAVRVLTPEVSISTQINLGAEIVESLYYSPKKQKPVQKKVWLAVIAAWPDRARRQMDKIITAGRDRPFLLTPVFIDRPGTKTSSDISDGYVLVDFEDNFKKAKFRSLLKNLDPAKPRLAHGFGSPRAFLDLVSAGADLIDGLLPNIAAEDGELFVNDPAGRGYRVVDVKAESQKSNFSPADSSCTCFACRQHTVADIHQFFSQDPGRGFRLATMHNLKYFLDSAESIRRAIEYGSFAELHKNFRKLKS